MNIWIRIFRIFASLVQRNGKPIQERYILLLHVSVLFDCNKNRVINISAFPFESGRIEYITLFTMGQF